MKLNLIKNRDGDIINLDNVFSVEYHEDYDGTYARFNAKGDGIIIADGDVRNLLWNGRTDFTEVNYGA